MVRCSYSENEIQETTTVSNGEFLMGQPVEKCPIAVQDVSFATRQIFHHKPDGKAEVKVVKTVDGERSYVANLKEIYDRDAFRAKITIKFADDEKIYGLGQDENGVYNKRGTAEYLYQHNMKIPMPMFVSSKGYGVLFDCACLMVFDDRKELCELTLECVDQVDFYVITGSFDEIVAGFRELTGRTSKMPPWVFGYWQSKERYHTQDELIEIAQKYRDLKVPIDVVVQDWKTWEEGLWGDKNFDKTRFPDMQSASKTLHDMNVHSIVSVWPNMNAGGRNHQEFADKEMLLGDYSTYDAFRADARDVYWKQAEKELFSGGFDGWWCDSTEPFASPDWGGAVLLPEEERYRLVGEEHEKYLDPAVANMYANVHAMGMYEHQSGKPMVNLTRSGWAGVQQYGTILWAGDTSATWGELKKEIAKGLNVSYSGIPYWTVDGGAFFTGSLACWRKWSGNPEADPVWFWQGDYDKGVDDLGYQELYTRWLQFACFLPIFRSHGTDTPREVWYFASPFREAIETIIRLRYQFMPYILEMAEAVHDDHATMMRGLMFDFLDDPEVHTIDTQYMFGKDLLICPVLKAILYNANSEKVAEPDETQKVYLPKGTDWVSFHTKEEFTGGQWIAVPITLEEIPIFVRKGATIPMQENAMHAQDDTPIRQVKF